MTWLLAVTLITGCVVVIHLLYLLFHFLLKDNSYNQNLWLRDGRFVTGDSYREVISLMDLKELQDATVLKGVMPEKVTSAFSAVYIRLYQVETGCCFDCYMENNLFIGRGNGMEKQKTGRIYLADPMVSKKHCQLCRKADLIEILDLDSKNHTYVNGCRVEHALPVNHGDMIRIGHYTYQLQCYYQR